MEENCVNKMNQIIALGKEVQIHLDKISPKEMKEFQKDLKYVKSQVRKEVYNKDVDYLPH